VAIALTEVGDLKTQTVSLHGGTDPGVGSVEEQAHHD
jgi:predicted aconitase with swiveling domain